MDLFSHIREPLNEVERVMEDELKKEDERIYGMLVPFLKRGGKRIRPALCILSCGSVGGNHKDAIHPSAIIELFHNFTLIHDDIEDDSRFRRGEPTLHVSHGLPLALNSGDALYTFLWKKIISLNMEPSKHLELQRLYVDAFKRVVDGQGIELSWINNGRFDVSEKEYLDMINGKTSALIGLSCSVGSYIGGADDNLRNALYTFGEKLGTAFQIQDDILNVSGDFEKYQKEIGGDITEGKRTLMVVHCLENAKDEHKEKIISVLSSHSKKKDDISSVVSIMNEYGSIDYARTIASGLVEEAKASIKDLSPSLDKNSLLSMADYVVNREK